MGMGTKLHRCSNKTGTDKQISPQGKKLAKLDQNIRMCKTIRFSEHGTLQTTWVFITKLQVMIKISFSQMTIDKLVYFYITGHFRVFIRVSFKGWGERIFRQVSVRRMAGKAQWSVKLINQKWCIYRWRAWTCW